MEIGHESCGTGCGMIAALVGCICFGSFGAPLKSEAVNMVNPDPFVLQTYKSVMYFITCWLVLFLDVEFEFTSWGILSGLMWVTGGVCGIFGIRNAGLAISVGTWSSITVIVAFLWGILFFDEQVQSIVGTTFSVLLVLVGFLGMTYFSSPNHGNYYNQNASPLAEPLLGSIVEEASLCAEGDIHDLEESTVVELMDQIDHIIDENGSNETDFETPIENRSESSNSGLLDEQNEERISFAGISVDKKLLGILGAAVDGILGGSNLIPMKLAPSIDRGLDYVISFAIGAAIATLLGWWLYLLKNSYREGSFKAGFESLPSLHLRKICFHGALSGTLWSLGNVGQILSVTYLGESIGMSIVQSQMIISGLLGILIFKEIKGTRTIAMWGVSAVVTFGGIVLLSEEHKS